MKNWLTLGVALAQQWSVFASFDFPLPVRITEIMYNPVGGDAYEFLELQNLGATAVDLSRFRVSGIGFTFPTNSVVSPGGVIVLASEVDPPAFSARYAGVKVAGFYKGHLSDLGERIALEDRARNTVTSVTYGPSGFWPIAANGNGFSLEVINSNGDPNDPANWRASSAPNGTPGTVPASPPAPVVQLNELMAANAGSPSAPASWVELFNAGATSVNLGGWSLTDDGALTRKFVFPVATALPPHAFLVILFDNAMGAPGVHAGFSLSPTSRTIGLFDASGNRVDAVSFGSQVANFSLGRFGSQWKLATPTPGADNTPAPTGSPANLILNEWSAASFMGDPDWIEIFNRSTTDPVELRGLFLTGMHGTFQIKSHSFVAPRGFVHLLADEQPGPDHVDFKLPATAGFLVLSDANGQMIDRIDYQPQSDGLSQGRFPDGSNHLAFFLAGLAVGQGASSLPDRPGSLSGRTAMNLEAARISPQTASLRFQAFPGRTYSVLYRSQPGAGPWTKLTDLDAPSTTQMLDVSVPLGNGAPARFFRIVSPRLVEGNAPVVRTVSPADNAANVPASTAISVTFREPMDASGVSTNSVRVTDDLGRALAGKFHFSDSFSTVTFLPEVPFAHATTFTVTVADRLKNAAGAVLPSAVTWRFQTAPSPDLAEDRSVYGNDSFEVPEVRISLLPRPGGYTLVDVNNDSDASSPLHPSVPVIFREGTFGQGLTTPNGNIEQRAETVRLARQKSYRVHLMKGSKKWRGQKAINFNKEPFDLTRVRDKISFDFFKMVPHLTSFRTVFVHLFINDVDFGLFTEIENPDTSYLKAHGLDANGQFYKADFFEFFRYPELLRLRTDPGFSEADFATILKPKGDAHHQKLLSMLDDLNNPNIPINRVIDKYFNRDNYLAWLACNILLNAVDTSSRNFYLYSPSDSSAWYFVPWDYHDAWGFYQQPVEAVRPYLSRWQEGIANWWGTVLHRRFLKEDPANLPQLVARVTQLATNVFTTAQTAQFLNRYHDVIQSDIQQAPNSMNLPLSGMRDALSEFNGEFFRLTDLVSRNYTNFLQTLQRPMPVFLSDPQQIGSQWFFDWDPSFSFQGDPLVYDFQISRSPSFDPRAGLVVNRPGLTDINVTVSDRLPSGTNYWRVVIRDKNSPDINWQVPFDNVFDPQTGAVLYHSVKSLIVP